MERATEKLEKHKQRMAEYTGDEWDSTSGSNTGTFAPFVANTKSTIDECGNLVHRIVADMEEGDADVCKANLQMLFTKLGGVRDEAQAVEEATTKVQEDQGGWDSDRDEDSDDENWEHDWWPNNDQQEDKGEAKREDPRNIVIHKGETWIATLRHDEGAVAWEGSYWKKAAVETAGLDQAPQERPADKSRQMEASKQTAQTIIAIHDSQGNNEDSVCSTRTRTKDEDMPHAVGQDEPNKKSRVE